MSEQLLKALMQLFAIIARPESNRSDRRTIVESFLDRQLNRELVEEYLKVFDYYYELHQGKQKERGQRAIAANSVKVLKICHQINEELTDKQKVIVLVQLFEFVQSDSEEISEQELEFIKTVSESFKINWDDYNKINDFVTFPADKEIEPGELLIINSIPESDSDKGMHLYVEGLSGQIRVLHISDANMYFFKYYGQSEIYMNGQLLQQDKSYVFNTGSSIRNPHIKPIYYGDVVSKFNVDILKSKINFEVHNVDFRFKNGKYGLHDVTFSEESGHLVGIMGSSGAGKSTLLNVLNGSSKPTSGRVEINGVDIYNKKEGIEGIIGHVSQDDLLIEELTVFQNLYYNAKLCFDNYTEVEILNTVDKTLQNLGLSEIKDIQVGSPLNKKISGGQRKRLNIALELIREPAILFLDEPTSGLSSRDSENIMDLLKELALKGKLLFVVIHQPSSDIFKMFDKLLILDTGGYLIYNGDPIDSIIYFKERIHHANWNESECHACGNVNPEQIFNIVEANVLDEYGKLTYTRKVSPLEWAFYFKKFSVDKDRKVDYADKLPEVSFKTPNKFKQFVIFAKRDILSKLSDLQYLIINLLEAPVLAFILSFIIKYYDVSTTNEYGYTYEGNSNIPVYLFISVIVAIFMGLTVSAEEIIKDRKILKRESFLNLSWASYLFSKVGVLFIISAVQAFLFVILGNYIVEIKGMLFFYWLMLFSAWASSNVLGLVISDSFKTVVTIYILIPFLVIPQIVLSGVIVKYEKLNPEISSPSSIPFYGEIITARWAYEGLAVHQFKVNVYEKELYLYDKAMSKAEFKKNYWVPQLETKIDFIERNKDNPDYNDKNVTNLLYLRNEITHENKINQIVQYDGVSDLYFNKINEQTFVDLRDYINDIKKYYIKLFNKANQEKDKKISSIQTTQEEKDVFLQMKREYNNQKLVDFVENKNEVVKIIEYDGNIYQKTDPIYLDPEYKFIKAHFYAPRKMMFGKYYDTFWVNVFVIWAMTTFFFVILYFRLLRKALDFFDNLSSRFSRNSNDFAE